MLPRGQPVSVACDRFLVDRPLAFHPDSRLPPPAIREVLDQVVRTLRERREIQMVRVEGYSSRELSPGASARSRLREQRGSLRRAEAVFRYLHLQKGITAERLDAVGYGHVASEVLPGVRWPIVLRIVHRADRPNPVNVR